jgi:hypothetical protein
MDSTASDLREFSTAIQLLHTGEYEDAIDAASQLLENPAHSFSDDLIVQFANQLPGRFQPYVLSQLREQISKNKQSPIRERLMWEQAEIANQLLTASASVSDIPPNERYYELEESMYEYQTDEQRFFNRETTLLLNESSVRDMYESILLEFPEGFYAHYVREKLQQNEAQTL